MAPSPSARGRVVHAKVRQLGQPADSASTSIHTATFQPGDYPMTPKSEGPGFFLVSKRKGWALVT